jgi:hypothetical protein
MGKIIKPVTSKKLKKIPPVNAGSTNKHKIQKTPKALMHGVVKNEEIYGK